MAPAQSADDDRTRRKVVHIGKETVDNITSTDFPGHYPGEDHQSWSLRRFQDGLSVKFYKNSYDEASFSLMGIDASIANAFRRIILSETPTLAIEKVYVSNNTSVVADEVLAHRIGLVPFKGSLAGLKWLKWFVEPNPDENFQGMEKTDYNTVGFSLQVKCEHNPEADRDEKDPKKKYINSSVYAKDIIWKPLGQQAKRFADGPIVPVSDEILLAKMRPGQELDMQMHARLGVGKDHAKFSPVATATYRLMPLITITKPILGPDARKFQQCFPLGVIDLERVTATEAASGTTEYEGREGDEKAVVKDAFRDTVSRECLRHDEFNGKVKLGRVQDHFIFNIETTGQYPSDMLFIDAVEVLRFKATRLLRALDKLDA